MVLANPLLRVVILIFTGLCSRKKGARGNFLALLLGYWRLDDQIIDEAKQGVCFL